jgi:hypothetical protein
MNSTKQLMLIALLMATVTLVMPIMAQDSTSLINVPPEPESDSNVITPMSRFEYLLSMTILVFGLIVIGLEVYLIKTRKLNPDDTIKFIVITLIITSTLFLITAGYSNDQIAPAVGLLGTIAGYLLGRIHKPYQNGGDQKDENQA